MSHEEVLEQPGARWSPWVVVVIVVVLLGALGVGVWVLRRPPAGPLPPPDGPWPRTGEAIVFLCQRDSTPGNCGDGEVTAAQRLTIERALRGQPEVSGLRLKSRAEALRDFKANQNLSAALRSAVRESDMPESFVAGLASMGDFRRKAEALPGVWSVFLHGTSFWAGKTDVVIRLCPPDPQEPESSDRDSRCRGRGAASADEKAAVHQVVRALDGIGAIYLEDRGHAIKDAFWVAFATPPDGRKPVGYIPESFHLVLDAPDADARVRRVVGELPGVNTVDKELS
ncbi:permease-like cell division protein FtsX [Sphaerisporangium sp. NPDC051017]|uniref:permease-like cell division protein FtsX n=1 Tax=Sphaerisporangium sp. NPDC051017 TaxID=3154636 RepID=UPI00343C3497